MHTNHSILHIIGRITGSVLVGALALVEPSPASAANTKLSGTAVYDDAQDPVCDPAPDGFTSYPPLVLTGTLDGCWYTKILTIKDNGAPSGVYLETGEEFFTGTLDGEHVEFTTTYKFEAKFDPDSGAEIHGRCQHPIVEGFSDSGEITGRVDFKDIVEDGSFVYRGHIRQL
ncbi:hypothetical protein [Nannocystis sp. SCPEA4]|uniref:hypothetical protein n=1 Tax=Nannocystis sp. SCPEA4 TaxID=2996787 RepID=UPI00227147D5|nr:hypothetical protein [Nannocystis sp. SCPEA4]MCY1061219.1 hypothetical protein [Nannocystis sp. SCPEA4]